MRISDWSSDVCSSDLGGGLERDQARSTTISRAFNSAAPGGFYLGKRFASRWYGSSAKTLCINGHLVYVVARGGTSVGLASIQPAINDQMRSIMAVGVWISLTLYFLLMLAIGFYAMRQATSSSQQYLLADRNLHPAVAALSAGASDMSGWLLLGLPGAIFIAGLQEAWIGVGLWVGALINWIIVAPRLREQTERNDNALTIPAFLANRDRKSTSLNSSH